MKARAMLVLLLVLSLALVPVLASVPTVHAATGLYSEKLDVYTAGQNALWSITMDRLAATLPGMKNAEGASGLTSYRLVAMSTQSAVSDFQIFGVDGYNLLKLPSMPSEGLFLTVNATSSSAQSSVVAAFDQQFGTNFTSVSSSSSSGSSTYYAPVDFVNVAAPTLYKLVPTSLGGFASFAPEATLVTVPMPFIELTAVNNGSGFSHTIAVGAASSDILGSANAINLSELIGSANATMSASPSSNSSQVVIHSLDGVITSTDKTATLSDHAANLSGSYSLTVPAGKPVSVNATLESQPSTAIAYRLLDHGTLTENDSLGVTIVIANTAESGAILNVTADDNWWMSYPGVFKLSSGNYSFTIPSLAAGQNESETYVLKVIASNASQVTIPTSTLTYAYRLSSDNFTGHATIGEDVVQVNNVGPALSVTARSSVLSGSPLGTRWNYSITVTNDGNSAALDVKLDNYTIGSIAPDGGSSTLEVPVQLTSLTDRNLSRTFSLEYSNTVGQTQNLTLNSVDLVLAHSAMVLPFIEVRTNDTLTTAALAARSLNVTYTFTNAGKGTPAGISATDTLPAGVSCKVVKGNGTCSGSVYTFSAATVKTQSNTLNVTFARSNYIIMPTAVATSYEGITLHSIGGAYEIPAGVSVTKTFDPGAAFPGMDSVVTVSVHDLGSQTIYNTNVSAEFDSFDRSTNGSTGFKSFPAIAPGTNSSFDYPVAIFGTSYGNLTASTVPVKFLLGGTTQQLTLGNASMTVYRPVSTTVATTPSTPEENHDFTMTITIENPSAVSVSDVVYTLHLPSGVTVVSGATVTGHTITITVPSMAADSNKTVSLTLSTGMGLTIDTASSVLTFQYAGKTLAGLPGASTIVVNVDATTRYTVPIVVAILIALAAVVYVRRRVVIDAKP